MNDLEKKFLLAKEKYYEGNPIMTDSAFDELERNIDNEKLKNYVGYFDRKAKIKHPSKMGSLSKIQANKETGEPPFEDFIKWCENILNLVKKVNYPIEIELSQKLDGNAINLIYENGFLKHALSRGNGVYGRDYISKIDKKQIPTEIPLKNNTVEIRCEAVVQKELFEKKYSNSFSNERNYVAGILNLDEESEEKYSEIDLIPVEMHEVNRDGSIIYHNISEIKTWGFAHYNDLFLTYFNIIEFNETYIKNSFRILFDTYESFKLKKSPYRIDGFVAKINAKFRKDIGETEHHPKWAIAIKFKPENSSTEVIGMDLKIGKTGSFTPVILLKPVDLDGSIVSRVSGYNYKYIKENKIGNGTIVTIVKSGDIIPQITSIDYTNGESFDFPENCPYCGNKLEVINNTHLVCVNNNCKGKELFKFINSFNALELDGVGESLLETIFNLCDKNPLFYIENLKDITKEYFIKKGVKDGKIIENFIAKLKDISKINIENILAFMSLEGISLGGKTTSEIAKKLSNVSYSFNGLEKKVVDGWDEGEINFNRFFAVKNAFEKAGIQIIYKKDVNGFFKFCLTGSPKKFGFSSKKEYLEFLSNKGINAIETNVKDCDFLITDDINSTSSKMKQAAKLNKKIVEYNFNFN